MKKNNIVDMQQFKVEKALISAKLQDAQSLTGRLLRQSLSLELEDRVDIENQIKHISRDLCELNNSLIELLLTYKLKEKQIFLNCMQYSVYDFLQSQAVFSMYFAKNSSPVFVEVICPKDLLWNFDLFTLNVVLKKIIICSIKNANKKITLKADVKDEMLLIKISDDGSKFDSNLLGVVNEVDINGFCDERQVINFVAAIVKLYANVQRKGYLELKNNDMGRTFGVYLPK